MNSKTRGIEVLAATAWVGGPATLPHRIVLCRRSERGNAVPQPFVVWTEVDHSEGRSRPHPESNYGFSDGDYCDDLETAWDAYANRARRILAVEFRGYEAANVIKGRTL